MTSIQSATIFVCYRCKQSEPAAQSWPLFTNKWTWVLLWPQTLVQKSQADWLRFNVPFNTKFGQFGDALPSQSHGKYWENLKSQVSQATQNHCGDYLCVVVPSVQGQLLSLWFLPLQWYNGVQTKEQVVPFSKACDYQTFVLLQTAIPGDPENLLDLLQWLLGVRGFFVHIVIWCFGGDSTWTCTVPLNNWRTESDSEWLCSAVDHLRHSR